MPPIHDFSRFSHSSLASLRDNPSLDTNPELVLSETSPNHIPRRLKKIYFNAQLQYSYTLMPGCGQRKRGIVGLSCPQGDIAKSPFTPSTDPQKSQILGSNYQDIQVGSPSSKKAQRACFLPRRQAFHSFCFLPTLRTQSPSLWPGICW